MGNKELIVEYEKRLKEARESEAFGGETDFLTNAILEIKWSCLHPKCNEMLGRHLDHISSFDGYDRYCVDCFNDLDLKLENGYYLCETLEMERKRKSVSFLPQSYYEPVKK